jgi:hypothetical protein
MRSGERVSADGVRRPIAMGVPASACAQNNGGVVRMEDGAVTFKGGSISNTKAVVRAPSASRASARRGMVCCAVRHGRWMARMVRRTHAAAQQCCMVYGACGGSGACEYAFRIVGEGATPSGRGVLHTALAGHDARALVTHRVARVPNRKDACFGARCMLHQSTLHRLTLRVASARLARCIGDAQPSRSAFAVWCVVRALHVPCSIGRRPGCCGGRAAAGCTRVQLFGGVLSMTKGTALFDAVAIFGTEAEARAGLVRRCAVGERVSADGVRRPIAMGVPASACAQNNGGVVRMEDGAVTFKGGSISNTTAAVRAPSASRASARRGMVCWAARHGRWMARTVRRTHAAASGERCTAH